MIWMSSKRKFPNKKKERKVGFNVLDWRNYHKLFVHFIIITILIREIITNYFCILLRLLYQSEKLLQIICAFYYNYHINHCFLQSSSEPGKSPELSSKEAPGTLLALASDGTVHKSDAATTNPASPDEEKAEVAIENSKPDLPSPAKESISLGDLEKVEDSRFEAGDSAASGEKASKSE